MSRSLAASCSFALLTAFAVPPQQPNDAGKPTWTRERAIAALRSDSAAEQFVAAQQLEYYGPAVLADLRKLRDDTNDPALRSRIENVLGGIELQHPGGLVVVFPRGEIIRNELWAWRDGQEIALTANTTMEADLALSPDGRHLLFSTTPDHHDFGVHDLHAIELATGTEVLKDRGHGGTFSPDGVHVAILRQDGLVLRELGRDGERRLAPELGEVREAQWSPEGRFVVFVDEGGKLQLLHVRSGRTRTLAKMDVGYGPSTTSFAPAVWFAQGRPMPAFRGIAPAAK